MIQAKERKCKGTGDAIGHGCGELNMQRTYGLGHKCKCYQTWLLTSDLGKAKLSRATIKVTAPRIELQKATEERKERSKLSYLKVNTMNACHEYVRLRDKGKPCISCGAPWQSNHQAGHLFKAELFSTLKYDEKNISSQCIPCNIRKEGNESGYRVGVLNRYGKEHLDYLDDLAQLEKQKTHKWERGVLESTRKYYQEKIKELKRSTSSE